MSARFALVVRGGTVVDGTGTPARTADIAVTDGRVVEVGRITGAARRTVDADGALVTPGFVDIHTHYDGQATWDSSLAPSSCNARAATPPPGWVCTTVASWAPGYRADLNVIDFDSLRLHRPEMHYDLPAGGKRLLQRASGYRHTFVAGVETYRDGVATVQQAGRLVRGQQPSPG